MAVDRRLPPPLLAKPGTFLRCYGSYEEVLANQNVQAVYIAIPHPFHAEWAIKAAEAGKHILCEKPLALNHAEAMAVVEAATRQDVFLMEAYMYRCHPQITKLVEIIRAGDNWSGFLRLDRVKTLAEERGVLPITIALAYVLCQPFPTFPLIGPCLLAETRTSLLACTILLTQQEIRWLNLEN